MDGIDRQKEYFESLSEILLPFIKVTKNWLNGGQYTPGKQQPIGQGRKACPPLDHYTIGSNEIVIDLDAKTYKMNAAIAMDIQEYLFSQNIPHHIYHSGGKGIHIHIYFSNPTINKPESIELIRNAQKKGCNIWKEIRVSLARELLEEAGINPEWIGRGKGKVVDLAKLDWNDLAGKQALIRACGGAHIKMDNFGNKIIGHKSYLEQIPTSKPKAVLFNDVIYPKFWREYQLTEEEVCRIISKYISIESNLVKVSDIEYDGEHLNLPCIQKLLEGGCAGSRSFSSQQIAIACRKDGKTLGEAKEIIQVYVDNCEQIPEPFTIEEAHKWVEWVYKLHEPYFACGLSKRLDVCDEHTCMYKKKKTETAVLSIGDDPLKLVKEILDEGYVGDDVLKMNLFFVYLTRLFNPDWAVIIDGGTSEGKSKGAKVVANLFGDKNENWFTVSRFTQASLNHIDEIAKKWENGLVIIEEFQGARAVLEQLRVLISERELTLFIPEKYTDKDGNEKIATVEKRVEVKNTLFVTCQAEAEDEGGQFRSRSWILNTDPSHQQNKAVGTYYVEEFMGDTHIDTEKLAKFRIYYDSLQMPDRIIYLGDHPLTDDIPYNNPRSRRDIQKYINMIKAVAHFYGPYREWYTDKKTGERVLIADDRDVRIVQRWAWNTLTASAQGLGSNDLKHFKVLESVLSSPSTPNAFTANDVQKWLSMSSSTAYRFIGSVKKAGFLEELGTYPVQYKKVGSPTVSNSSIDLDSDYYSKDKIARWVKNHGA